MSSVRTQEGKGSVSQKDKEAKRKDINSVSTQTEFGNMLRRIRNKNDLLQKQLAELSGLTATRISLWEQGKELPRKTGVVLRLAKALDVRSDELLIPLMNDIERRERNKCQKKEKLSTEKCTTD